LNVVAPFVVHARATGVPEPIKSRIQVVNGNFRETDVIGKTRCAKGSHREGCCVKRDTESIHHTLKGSGSAFVSLEKQIKIA
jgi:hypothetical protein